MDDLTLENGLSIPARELSWTAVTAGGPGGQHVNKVATKVQLRWDMANSEAIPRWARVRLVAIAGRRVDADGCVQVSSTLTRSQDRNIKDARARLAALVSEAFSPPKIRRPTKPTRGSKRRRLDDKRKHSQKKQGRRGHFD